MKPVRRRLLVRGTVQGVGFRPFVYRLATALRLAGSVGNTPDGVVVEIEGDHARVEEFTQRLSAEAPPLARIVDLQATEVTPTGETGFHIIPSAAGDRPTALIPPDVALCPDCGREIAEFEDRRYGYPFTNCTNCGPRFSIVLGIPYDRLQTTMSVFDMCPRCRAEYANPENRRFHAEPIACPECGPSLCLDGAPAPDGIARVARLLAEGRIVAIKGLGGYHLACDARSPQAVERLRTRKGRGQKPFAIMVRDLAEARRVAQVSAKAEAILTSPESPVVIMPAKAGGGLAPGIAPRQATVGVMLPYTPLHRLLLARRSCGRLDQSPSALVMTSGNLAEEPIVHQDDEARRKLGPIADHILSHNREIAVPCDDSVVRVDGDLVIPVRRARGYVPRSVPMPDIEGPPVLAVGGYHKNTFCLLRDGQAILSQHIGDLDTAEVLDYFARAIQHFQRLFEVTPKVIAHDLHPGYLSTQYAQSLPGVRLVPVQHHHAHVVSVMAELGLEGPVIGVSYDGTGYGSDGTAWGGEILIADRRDFTRAMHLRPLPMPGGEGAIRYPARMALSYLWDAFGDDALEIAHRLLPSLTDAEARIVLRQIQRGLNSPLTSSMGRLFDAVGALLGATPEATYEGQPAMELEAMAASGGAGDELLPYDYELTDGMIDTRPLVRAIAAEVKRGVEAAQIAARFHETVAAFTVDACQRLHAQGAPREVVLCGGVMQNARLLARLIERLSEIGLRPHIHREVPPNDGGMSLGQAVVGACIAVAPGEL